MSPPMLAHHLRLQSPRRVESRFEKEKASRNFLPAHGYQCIRCQASGHVSGMEMQRLEVF